MWYSQVVPTGNTPAIRDKNGEVVYDSMRILRYLEQTYPDRPLLPSDPALRALADELLDAFARTMPQGARPSSRGAYLYRGSGLPLPQAASSPPGLAASVSFARPTAAAAAGA